MADELTECWRCDHCNLLIYNVQELDGRLYPAPGAPTPKYVSKMYPKVCSLCFDLHHILAESTYFMKIQTAYEEERDKRNKKASGGWSVA
jgi:hypothetical protein